MVDIKISIQGQGSISLDLPGDELPLGERGGASSRATGAESSSGGGAHSARQPEFLEITPQGHDAQLGEAVSGWVVWENGPPSETGGAEAQESAAFAPSAAEAATTEGFIGMDAFDSPTEWSVTPGPTAGEQVAAPDGEERASVPTQRRETPPTGTAASTSTSTPPPTLGQAEGTEVSGASGASVGLSDPAALSSTEFSALLSGPDKALAGGHAAVKLATYFDQVERYGGKYRVPKGALTPEELKKASGATELPKDVREAAQFFVDNPGELAATGAAGTITPEHLLAHAQARGVASDAARSAVTSRAAAAADRAQLSAPTAEPKPGAPSTLDSASFLKILGGEDRNLAAGHAAIKLAWSFDRIESDGGDGKGDGIISFSELGSASRNPALPADVRAAAEFFVQNRAQFDEMEVLGDSDGGKDELFAASELIKFAESKGVTNT